MTEIAATVILIIIAQVYICGWAIMYECRPEGYSKFRGFYMALIWPGLITAVILMENFEPASKTKRK